MLNMFLTSFWANGQVYEVKIIVHHLSSIYIKEPITEAIALPEMSCTRRTLCIIFNIVN